MRRQGSGSIVNMSSAAAYHGAPGLGVEYGASKGAIDVLTIGLGREVAAEQPRDDKRDSPRRKGKQFTDKTAEDAEQNRKTDDGEHHIVDQRHRYRGTTLPSSCSFCNCGRAFSAASRLL